jgi:opacity protein-like surface antigen
MTHWHVRFLLAAALATPGTSAVHASDWERNPLLDDTFRLSLGSFFASVDTELSVNGSSDIGADFDLDERFDLSDRETSLAGTFVWRFGEKWSVSFQHFDQEVSATAVLDQDVEWGDFVLEQGSNVSAGTFNDVYRVFFGRKLLTGDNYEFGAGLGAHYMEIGAFANGEFILNGESTGVRREAVSASAPLPNIGAWYYYAWNKRWAGHARLDFLSANIDEYSGSLTNAAAGLSFQATRHLAIGLDYNYFKLDVDVESGNWKGAADLERSGPFLFLAGSW